MWTFNLLGGAVVSFFVPIGGGGGGAVSEQLQDDPALQGRANRRLTRLGARVCALSLAGAAVFGLAPMHSGFGITATASAAMLFDPAPIFSGVRTSQQKVELKAWGQAYWNRIEGANNNSGPGGSNSATAAWTFSDSAMNSPLFNPFYGPQQTLVSLGLRSANDCMKNDTEGGGTDANTISRRAAIKSAQVDFEFATDPVTDPAGTTNHVLRILDASSIADLIVYSASGRIISENLPLEVLVTAGVNSDFADSLSEESVTALLVLTNQAPVVVAAAADATEAQAMVGGQASKANAVASGIVALLSQSGITTATVQRMDAIFGVYGQLPLVYTALSDCAVLIDATTGAVTAPILLGSPLDAAGLLLLHPEAAESPFAHRMLGATGCIYPVAPTWQATPPTGVTLTPGVVPTSIPLGGPGRYSCTMVSNTNCSCTRSPTFTQPAGGTLLPGDVVTTCSYSGATCLPPGSGCQGASPAPEYPSGNPGSAPGNSQGCTLTCVTKYFY